MGAQEFLYRAGERELDVTIHLPGEHQVLNGAVALKVAELLAQKDAAITERAILKGMDETRWPGRLERIHEKPDIILDGAHNPSGVTVIEGFGPVSAAAHRGSRHTRSKARMLPQNKRRFMRIDLRFFPSYHSPLLSGKKKSLDRGPATCYTPTKETEEREK